MQPFSYLENPVKMMFVQKKKKKMAVCSTHCSTFLEKVKKRISAGPTTQAKLAKANTKFHR